MPSSKTRAPRNRTLTLSEDEHTALSKTLLTRVDPQNLSGVYWGDMLKILPQIPEKSVDLLVIDPPYNLRKTYNGTVFNASEEEAYEAILLDWMDAIYPVLKPTASIYVCCDWRTSISVYNVLKKRFIVRNRITWQREKGRGAKANWKNGMEDIWYATVSENYTFNLDAVKVRRKVIAPYKVNGAPKDWVESDSGNYRETCPSNFWDDITIPYWSMPENTDHPTQKPEKLIAKLILASSNSNDVVLDTFLGSGTTAVTAQKLGRKFIGIEREKEYCLWALKRLQMALTDSAIQGYDGHRFYERNANFTSK